MTAGTSGSSLRRTTLTASFASAGDEAVRTSIPAMAAAVPLAGSRMHAEMNRNQSSLPGSSSALRAWLDRIANESSAQGAPGSGVRSSLLIVTAFWVYVALSDVVYASSMRWVVGAMLGHRLFAPWTARLLQHLLLYPVLLGCVWASLLLGWRPILRRLPLQVMLAACFAALGYPAMELGLRLLGGSPAILLTRASFASALAFKTMFHTQMHIWLGASTSFFLTYGFALALGTGVQVHRRLRESQIRSAALERSLAAAHLASLRMQLSPHSLFNLLHTISGQIEWDPPAARSMVVQLGDLLRRLLNAGEREYSPLAEEMEFARLYLDLQVRRFADRLTVEMPPAAELPAVWVPSLILQPIVENAVVHGLAGHQGPVTVGVTAAVCQGTLTLRVTNTMATGHSPREGRIGLRNVRERLAIHFPGRASFNAAPDGQGRWIADIRMPCITDVLEPTVAACAEPTGRTI